jgi:hypothetical protein
MARIQQHQNLLPCPFNRQQRQSDSLNSASYRLCTLFVIIIAAIIVIIVIIQSQIAAVPAPFLRSLEELEARRVGLFLVVGKDHVPVCVRK